MSEEEYVQPPIGELPGDSLPTRKLYFINECVEYDILKYLFTGCTDVYLRDKIMENASELIRQIIRKQGLHTIYPGQEESSFGDLINTAWVQVERTLYKYRARPHCRTCYNPDRPSESLLYKPGDYEYGVKTFDEVIKMHNGKCPKCSTELSATPEVEPMQGRFGGSTTILYRGTSKVFNMWSQVSRTVILAYIKKEGRDRRNSSTYKAHLGNKPKPNSDILRRFFDETEEIVKHNDDYMKLVNALKELVDIDDRPHDGLIGKLVEQTGLSRSTVTGFIRHLKLRSFEFTDSPISRNLETEDSKIDKRRSIIEFEED